MNWKPIWFQFILPITLPYMVWAYVDIHPPSQTTCSPSCIPSGSNSWISLSTMFYETFKPCNCKWCQIPWYPPVESGLSGKETNLFLTLLISYLRFLLTSPIPTQKIKDVYWVSGEKDPSSEFRIFKFWLKLWFGISHLPNQCRK